MSKINTTTFAIPPEVLSFRYFGISIAVFTIIVGSIGNTLTILAYALNKKMRTTFNIFVVNLSFVDLITALLMLPFNLAGYVQLSWPFGNDSFTTRLQAFSYFSCGYTSVSILVAITMNRFIGIFAPRKYSSAFSRKRTIFILVFCWSFAPICLLPFMLGSDPLCANANRALTGYNEKQLLCTFICFPEKEWFIYMQIVRVTFQFVPLGIMAVAYSAMFFILRYRQKKNSIYKLTPAVSNNSIHSTTLMSTLPQSLTKETKVSRDLEMKKEKTRNLLLMISVVVCSTFVITFLPSVIINLLPNRKDIDIRWHMAASNLSWFNSALNPIIYAILNLNFRKEYIRLVMLLIAKIKVMLHIESKDKSNQKTVPSPGVSSFPLKLGVNKVDKNVKV